MDCDGNTGVVVFVYCLNKMDHLAAVSDSIDGKGTATLFIGLVFGQHGLPLAIIHDRDPRFTGKVSTSIFKVLGTQLKMFTVDQLYTDGQTERVNRVIGDVLCSVSAESAQTWSSSIPAIEFALNNAVHAPTGFTPFYVNSLKNPRVLLTLPLRGSGLGGGESADKIAEIIPHKMQK